MKYNNYFNIIITIVYAFISCESKADFKVCNNTNSQIDVAITKIGEPKHIYTVQGWWSIGPKVCKTTHRGNISPPGRRTDYYVYATSYDGVNKWTDRNGRNKFCIESEEFVTQNSINRPCRQGRYKASFSWVPTRNENEHTLTLNSNNPPPSTQNGQYIARNSKRRFKGVRDCNKSRAIREAEKSCDAVQNDLINSGRRIIQRYGANLLDWDAKVERYCTHRVAGICTGGYGNRCNGYVDAKCSFKVR